MKQKSWHLNRRTVLRSGSICLALPWLEGMSKDKSGSPPSRFFAGFFPYGVPMIDDENEHRFAHGWFPVGTGKDYKLTDMHRSIAPLREKITFVSGLSHPSMRKTSAHKGADVFLTGSQILNSYQYQSISIDQLIANSIGDETRYQSLVLSTQGGVNRPYRSSTISFNQAGNPIPTQNIPREIFRRLFGKETESEKNALSDRSSILDNVLKETKSLNRLLGENDKKKMDEYLTSIRSIEKMTERSKQWQTLAKPKVDASNLNLELDKSEPKEYLDLMYELIVLALQTDSTRVCSFQVATEEGKSENFPLAVGITKSAHKLSHEKVDYTEVAKYIGFLNERYSAFLSKLNSIQEGDGTLLDNTLCFYGCATSKTHRAVNYPIIMAGGKKLGFQHGSHLNFSEEIPLSNLFLTMAKQYDERVESFADSHGELTEFLS